MSNVQTRNIKSRLVYFRPKTLFLIDAIGALLTATLLGLLLPNLKPLFGMPTATLYLLAGIAIAFFIYSISCYFLVKENRKQWLRIISIFNFSYCVLSIACLIYFYSQLTTMDMLYFIGEIIIVAILASIEWLTASDQTIS